MDVVIFKFGVKKLYLNEKITVLYGMCINKDDNIHKSEALKLKDKRTLTLVECQNLISRILIYEYKQYCI